MKISRYSLLLLLSLGLVSSAQAGVGDWLKKKLDKSGSTTGLNVETVAAGLREALEQGAGRAVQTLGRDNGFWSHPRLRIPMPEKLQKAEQTLRKLGQGRLADDFVQSLNRAAEQATPAARDIFVSAIRRMSIRDAMDILKGPPDAATTFFRQHTEAALTGAFHPIVARTTTAVGVTARYKKLLKRIEPLGLADARDLDIDAYVTRQALDALFQLVAEEEGRIRRDPVARTTELLKQVFQ
jgi:hypothetical protein